MHALLSALLQAALQRAGPAGEQWPVVLAQPATQCACCRLCQAQNLVNGTPPTVSMPRLPLINVTPWHAGRLAERFCLPAAAAFTCQGNVVAQSAGMCCSPRLLPLYA